MLSSFSAVTEVLWFALRCARRDSTSSCVRTILLTRKPLLLFLVVVFVGVHASTDPEPEWVSFGSARFVVFTVLCCTMSTAPPVGLLPDSPHCSVLPRFVFSFQNGGFS